MSQVGLKNSGKFSNLSRTKKVHLKNAFSVGLKQIILGGKFTTVVLEELLHYFFLFSLLLCTV